MRLGHIYEDRSDSKAAEDASSSDDEEAEKSQVVQSEMRNANQEEVKGRYYFNDDQKTFWDLFRVAMTPLIFDSNCLPLPESELI